MDTLKPTINNDSPDEQIVMEKTPFMRPFLLLFCFSLMLLAACSKSSAIQSRMIGNWKLVAYTDARTQKVVYTPADSTVFLNFQFSKYEMIVKNVLESSGEYHITPPNSNSPYYYVNFGQSVGSQIDFRKDTMVLTAIMTLSYEPNQLQYVKN